ncbi:hypothetical protein IG611_15720 [Pectobacterium sp. A535-S3-A17]|uniref:hypothetical protein n=1 Tax=Pectobacterium quasiaquaticum TaxID=2774015 RepID=UPI001873E067|nr:hypothetical protein [Pectobacterium quasiaquaticum]MBE5215762.1 hypothetical protein [Pectobacterium quasiaquaticum]MBE5226791.1 hypothetical protein [Pectobacterium quasiaquaticum]
MATFAVRRINNSDLDDFRRVRLEALKLHPEVFGASFEEESQKPETRPVRNITNDELRSPVRAPDFHPPARSYKQVGEGHFVLE